MFRKVASTTETISQPSRLIQAVLLSHGENRALVTAAADYSTLSLPVANEPDARHYDQPALAHSNQLLADRHIAFLVDMNPHCVSSVRIVTLPKLAYQAQRETGQALTLALDDVPWACRPISEAP